MNQNLFILILAISGFAIAFYINRKKTKKEKLVCVIGQDCDKVVNSRYAAIFGVDNQILGMIYYFLVAIFSATLISGAVWPEFIRFSFRIISAGAAVFSFGLIFVQAFILKEWCEWCLGSALISLLISLEFFFVKFFISSL